MKPRRRLLVAVFVAFALALLGGTFIPTGLLSTRSHRESYLNQRLSETDGVVDSLRGRPPADQIRIIQDRYPKGGFTAGWLLDGTGRPVTEPTRADAFAVDPAQAPEVRRALRGPDSERFGDAPAGKRLYLAVPLIDDGTLHNVLWVSSSLRPVADLDRRSWALLGAIGLAALVVAVVIGFALAARLSRRVEALASAAERFGAGSFDEPIEIHGRDEIADLAKRLNQMAAGLSKAMRREKDFLSAAAHQIRTPLTTVRLRLEAIASRLEEGDEDTREYLGEMISEIDRLSDLTSKLLSLGAAEGRMGDPARVSVPSAVGGTVKRIEAVAASRQVTVETEGGDASIVAPPGAFEEVLMNLLDNAVKFSPPGGRVDVGWTVRNGTVRLTVSDGGPGVPAGTIERIFDPFYSGDRLRGGHGLGLTVSQRLCAASGARLSLATRGGGGTTAAIDWPAG